MVYSIKETINETVNQQAETPSNTKTKAVLNQAVADLSVAASIDRLPSSLVYAWSWFPLSSSKNG